MRNPPEAKFEAWAKQMPRAQLGGLIKEYIAESNHGGWEGFSLRDLTSIRKLLTDLMIYHDNAYNTPEEREFHFTCHLSNVNPVI